MRISVLALLMAVAPITAFAQQRGQQVEIVDPHGNPVTLGAGTQGTPSVSQPQAGQSKDASTTFTDGSTTRVIFGTAAQTGGAAVTPTSSWQIINNSASQTVGAVTTVPTAYCTKSPTVTPGLNVPGSFPLGANGSNSSPIGGGNVDTYLACRGYGAGWNTIISVSYF